MKGPVLDTPMYKAWLDYKDKPYYGYLAERVGLDASDPETDGVMWWVFSKGYEAAAGLGEGPPLVGYINSAQ